MNNIISKRGLGRICLWFFIFLCNVITCENAFSRPWQNNMHVVYSKIDGIFTFAFLYYSCVKNSLEHSYLTECDLQYSEDGINYKGLILTQTDLQDAKEVIWMKILHLKFNESIVFPYMQKRESISSNFVGTHLQRGVYDDGNKMVNCYDSHMIIKWTLPKSIKTIKNIKFTGTWTVSSNNPKSEISREINKLFPFNIGISKSNRLKQAPSEFNPEIKDKVKVTGETDAINVAGAEPGENIKVYTTTGAEVKSVVANNDALNIKLHKNQIYIVKAGQVRYKVAM